MLVTPGSELEDHRNFIKINFKLTFSPSPLLIFFTFQLSITHFWHSIVFFKNIVSVTSWLYFIPVYIQSTYHTLWLFPVMLSVSSECKIQFYNLDQSASSLTISCYCSLDVYRQVPRLPLGKPNSSSQRALTETAVHDL